MEFPRGLVEPMRERAAMGYQVRGCRKEVHPARPFHAGGDTSKKLQTCYESILAVR
jgi:hypothetical protein